MVLTGFSAASSILVGEFGSSSTSGPHKAQFTHQGGTSGMNGIARVGKTDGSWDAMLLAAIVDVLNLLHDTAKGVG